MMSMAFCIVYFLMWGSGRIHCHLFKIRPIPGRNEKNMEKARGSHGWRHLDCFAGLGHFHLMSLFRGWFLSALTSGNFKMLPRNWQKSAVRESKMGKKPEGGWEIRPLLLQVLKNWCFQTVDLEKTLERPLVCKEVKPVNPNGNQSWICIGMIDAEAETPILWPPDVKSWLFGTDPDAGKDWGQEEKGAAEDEMVGWHHWVSGHEFEQTLGNSGGQGGLVCCSPWGCKEPDTT